MCLALLGGEAGLACGGLAWVFLGCRGTPGADKSSRVCLRLTQWARCSQYATNMMMQTRNYLWLWVLWEPRGLEEILPACGYGQSCRLVLLNFLIFVYLFLFCFCFTLSFLSSFLPLTISSYSERLKYTFCSEDLRKKIV